MDHIVDAFHSGTKIDFDRMMENFDSGDFDEAQEKMNKFLLSMRQHRKLSADEYREAKKFLNQEIDAIREATLAEDERTAALEERARALDEITRAHEAANAENERWARTWEGMRKNNYIGKMEEDFKRLAAVMSDADMGKFADSFDSLHKARARVYEVTAAMEEQGRISRERAEEVQAHVNDFIDGEEAKAKAMREALDETKRLREAQDAYNTSLSGMARNYHFSKLENDFRNLAAAMDSNDFSQFARGARNIDQMRRSIADTAGQMHRLGRMTEAEYSYILERVEDVTHSFRDADERGKGMFRNLNDGARRFRTIMSRIGQGLDGTRRHLAGYAGLNVFSDMIRGGLDFIHNLDRIALRAGKVTTALGTMANLGGSSLASLAVIAGDLGAVLGGLAAVAPAYLVGTAIGVGVLYAALKDTKTVLKDLKKPLGKFQDAISADFWREAAQPIRDMTNYLLPILNNPNGTSTARSLGLVFGSLAKSIKDIPEDDINFMFDNMNNAIERAADAMPPMIRAFNNLGKAGSKTFGRFADWIVAGAESFDAFIQKAADSGELDRWIENMITGFKDLGRAIDGTFGIFNAIESAARDAGAGGLKEFADKLQGIAATMQSDRFQDSLTNLFSGMRVGAELVGQAVRDIGPAIESFIPTLSLSLIDIGNAASRIIGYIGDILGNPTVQKGVQDFTTSMVAALDRLEPAVKPFADSLGNVMTLLGDVLESVAAVTTAFMVDLSPELDKMSIKSAEMLRPLQDLAEKVIRTMKPVLESFTTNIVNPVVDAMNSSLIPAIDDFVGEAGPFLEKVIKELGPGIKILVDQVLPNAVKFATELVGPMGDLVALLSPTFAEAMQKVADGFDSLTDAMKVLKGEMGVGDLKLFDGLDPAKIKEQAEQARQTVATNLKGEGGTRWRDILSSLLWGEEPDVFWSMVWDRVKPDLEGIGPAIGKWWDEALANTQADLNNRDASQDIMDMLGRWLGDVWTSIGTWWSTAFEGTRDSVDSSGPSSDIIAVLGDWLNSVGEAVGKWWDETIGKWWDETIGAFWDKIFGGGDAANPISGAGGGGARGMGVSGTIDPAMLGLPDEAGVGSFFTTFGTWLSDGFTGALGQLGAALGLTDFGARWSEFWNTASTNSNTAWTNISTWTSTKAGEVKGSIDSFITDAGTNWTGFWDSANTKATEVWDAVSSWTSTKAGEVQGSISSFATDAGANWTSFWDSANTKATDIWNSVTSTTGTKAGEIQRGISSFGRDVGANWNSFWSSAETKVGESWRGIQSGAETGGRDVSSFFGGLPQTLKNAMGNVFSTFSTVGNSIASGMQSGINAGIEWVKGAAARVAQAAVDAAKWVLDINSPSKVFRSLGLSTGEGFVQGADRSGKSVTNAFTGMADLAVEAFAHSKMYLAGADAALGMAGGLASQKSVIAGVLGDIIPDASLSAKLTATAPGAGGAALAGRTVVLESGAVQVSTRASDPGLVASTVTDSLDEAFSKFSTL